MAEITLTNEQQAAIGAKDRPILVSAAAGSGKTFVLVNRLMEKITAPDSGRDITDFLVITYTRAAAAELRSRIRKELNDRLNEESGLSAAQRKHLRRQILLIQKAQISTIHSFCSALLKENAQTLGIRPDFSLMDETEAGDRKNAALERVMEEAYARVDSDPSFAALTELLVDQNRDHRLSAAVLNMYEKLQSLPDPDGWMTAQTAAVREENVQDLKDTAWGRDMLNKSAALIEWCIHRLREVCLELEGCAVRPEKWLDGLYALIDELLALREAAESGWDAMTALVPLSFPRVSYSRKISVERQKAAYGSCKEYLIDDLKKYEVSSAQALEDMRSVAAETEGLYDLVRSFGSAYAEEKRQAGKLDYSDLEHLTIRLLYRKGEQGEDWTATPAAEAVSRRFHEVMVDEYQDVNAVQEMILQALSGAGKRLYMVGDMKQSIYRFRQADVSIFRDKYQRFAAYDGSEGEDPAKILLSSNFRSSRGVIDGINAVFRNVMSERLGDLDYGEKEELRFGRTLPDAEGPACEILLYDAGGEKKNAEERRLLEASCVAAEIRRMVSEGTCIWEKQKNEGTETDVLRPLGYDDFAILLRTAKDTELVFRQALEDAGIPYSTSNGDSWFLSRETVLMLDLLEVIDNPRQDIPLINVLQSPLYGFSYEELSAIRAHDRHSDFFTVLTACSGGDGKIRAFLEQLDRFRMAARSLTVDRLIRIVLEQTSARILLCSGERGKTAENNLSSLLRFAEGFEAEGFRGLFRFNLRVRFLRENGKEPPSAEQAQGSGVKIMTIHKSKGLEFPVVFLCDSSRSFNKNDIREPVLFHRELGAGVMYRDSRQMCEYPTIHRSAVKEKLNEETLSEEMRVLYVALTRARERLCVPLFRDFAASRADGIRNDPETAVSPYALGREGSMAAWILAAVCGEEGMADALCASGEKDTGVWTVRTLGAPRDGGEQENGEREERTGPVDEELVERIRENLSFRYPEEEASEIPSKLTATELKAPGLQTEAAEEAYSVAVRGTRLRRPELQGKTRKLTGSERGTAMHCAMQFLDYSRCGSEAELEEEIRRLVRDRFLSQVQADAVDRSRILKLFSGELGKRIASAEHLHREFKFSLLTEAKDLLPVRTSDRVLFQGVVDCWLEEPDGITVIDFKTDRVDDAGLDAKVRQYERQVTLYADALNRMTGKPVREAYLYFFALDRAVSVPLKE